MQYPRLLNLSTFTRHYENLPSFTILRPPLTKPLNMKFTFLTAFLCACMVVSMAQTDSSSEFLLGQKCKPLLMGWFPTKRDPKPSVICRYAEVKDFRPDTARVGIIAEKKQNKQIQTTTPLSSIIGQYINSTFAGSSSPDSLFIVIRRCWIYDSIGKKATTKEIPMPAPEYHRMMTFRADAFCKVSGGLIAVTYLDTTAELIHNPISFTELYNADTRLPNLVGLLMDRIGGMDLADMRKTKRVIPYADWSAHYSSMYQAPIYTFPALKKGVYRTAEEFRNNAPSITEYQLTDVGEGISELFIRDETGQFTYTHKVWGYSDGKHCFAMMDGQTFPVLHIQNAFYVWGSLVYERKSDRSYGPPVFFSSSNVTYFWVPPGSASSMKTSRKMKMFRLDTGTGLIK